MKVDEVNHHPSPWSCYTPKKISVSNFRKVMKTNVENGPCKSITTSIMNLPDDCLLLIFQGLSNLIDRYSFGLTCHRWLQIQSSSRRSLWFNHYSTPSSQISPDTYSFRIYKLLTRYQQLSLLSLSHCTELRDSGMSQLLSFGSNIQTLYLDCCFGVSDIGFSLVASGCPCLTFISLYRCNITDTGLEALAKSCSSLEKVNLSCCAITDIGLESLSKSCSSLQKVNLSSCPLLSDRGIRILLQGCRKLCSVTISYCKNITGIGFNGCSENLANVEVVSCNLEPEGILGILSGGGIEYFNVSSLDVLGLVLAKIGEGFAMKLRVLNLRACRDVSNEVVMKISEGCPFLQEWNLAHNHQINLQGWEAIGSYCHNLEILHVNLCSNLCSSGLQALGNGCKRLRVLYMDNRYGRISHLAIELFKFRRADVTIREKEILGKKRRMGKRRKQLVGMKIEMEDDSENNTATSSLINNLPDDCLFLIFQRLKKPKDRNSISLTCLRWFRIQNLSRRSLRLIYPVTSFSSSMISVCPNLRTISLQSCNITDIALESLAKSCSSLQKVDLSHCRRLSDSGIRILLQECRKLRVVVISHCREITGTGFNGCSQTLTRLQADSSRLKPEGILGIFSGGGLKHLSLSNLFSYLAGNAVTKIGEGIAVNLRVLNLRKCESVVSSEAVIKISKGCPVLEEWNLAHCHAVDLYGWEAIGSNCHNLLILHVNHCRNLGPRGLQALGNGCTRLSKLYISRCYIPICSSIELFESRRANVKILDCELGMNFKGFF